MCHEETVCMEFGLHFIFHQDDQAKYNVNFRYNWQCFSHCSPGPSKFGKGRGRDLNSLSIYVISVIVGINSIILLLVYDQLLLLVLVLNVFSSSNSLTLPKLATRNPDPSPQSHDIYHICMCKITFRIVQESGLHLSISDLPAYVWQMPGQS